MTQYPVGINVRGWVMEKGYFSPKPERLLDPKFVGSFSSVLLGMISAAGRVTNDASRWAKWLGIVPLAVFLVASQMAMHEEAQIFAAGTGTSTTSRPVALSLKGKLFYVTDEQKHVHQLSQGAAFGAMATFFGWLIWVRGKGRRAASPALG